MNIVTAITKRIFLLGVCACMLMPGLAAPGEVLGSVDLSGYTPMGRVPWYHNKGIKEVADDLAAKSPELRDEIFVALAKDVNGVDKGVLLKELMAYYIDQAWELYAATRSDIDEVDYIDKEAVTRDIIVQIYKSKELLSEGRDLVVGKDGLPVPVRMRSSFKPELNKLVLDIACDAFDASIPTEMRIAEIAREVLGYGIVQRYYSHQLVKPEFRKEGKAVEVTPENRDEAGSIMEAGIALAVECGTYGKQREKMREMILLPFYYQMFHAKTPWAEKYAKGFDSIKKRNYRVPDQFPPKVIALAFIDGGICMRKEVMEWSFDSFREEMCPEPEPVIEPEHITEVPAAVEKLKLMLERYKVYTVASTPGKAQVKTCLYDTKTKKPYKRTNLISFPLLDIDTEIFVKALSSLTADELDNLICNIMSDAARQEMMAFLLDTAWNAYTKTSTDMHTDMSFSQTIITRVVQFDFYKSGDLVSNSGKVDVATGKPLNVPMASSIVGQNDDKYSLVRVSCNSFGLNDDGKPTFGYEKLVAKIAHEALGHAFVRRYFEPILVRTGSGWDIFEEGICIAVEAATYAQMANTPGLSLNDYFSQHYQKASPTSLYAQGVKAVQRGFLNPQTGKIEPYVNSKDNGINFTYDTTERAFAQFQQEKANYPVK